MYDQPELRQQLKDEIMEEEVAGTAAGKWSARKAQLLKRRYEQAGGGYIGEKTESQLSLSRWSRQKWTTKSGRKSSETGERYLPQEAIDNLSDEEYEETTAAKRRDTALGKQYSRQPKEIARKTREYR